MPPPQSLVSNKAVAPIEPVLCTSTEIETPRLYKDKAKLASVTQTTTSHLETLISATSSTRAAAAAAKLLDDTTSMPAICFACRAGGESSALKVLINSVRTDEGIPMDDRKGLALAVDRNRGWKLMTPVMFASGLEGALCLTELIMLGCDLNLKDSFDNTALHHASTAGSLSALQLLIEPVVTLRVRSDKVIPTAVLVGASNGASINAQNGAGRTAIHIAANSGHLSCVQYLISQGAEINITDTRFRMTPLHLSAAAGNEKIVKVLLEKGADVSAVDSKGRTAFMCCSTKSCEEAFKESS